MPNNDAAIIAAVLREQLGKTATFRIYDRSLKTPLNFVLRTVEEELTEPFSVYWVENGLPELFCLHGFSPTPVVYNTRYIEIVSWVRRLVTLDGMSRDIRIELARRTCLRLMAELAVRYQSPDWAVRAFLESILDQTVFIADIPGTALMDLEQQPIGEAYVATWFFGLVHELGHVWLNRENENELAHRALTPQSILAAVEVALDRFPTYPPEIRRLGLDAAREDKPDFPLSPSHIRSEAAADVFAMSTLFRATVKIMQELGTKLFRPEQFVAEMTIFIALISIIDNCRRVALVAADPEQDRDQLKTPMLFQPVTYAVRALLGRQYLDHAIGAYLFDTSDPSADQLKKAERLVNDINKGLQPVLDEVEKGMAQALRFALFPDERRTNLMRAFAERSTDAFVLSEAVRFCDLAASFHQSNDSVSALKRVASAAIARQRRN